MSSALIPEFAVSDWRDSKRFYCQIPGFQSIYERVEEGFCYRLEGAPQAAVRRDA